MNEKIFSLPVLNQLTPYLSQRQMGELPVMVITHPKVRAAVALQGAHLVAWQPSGEKPVIWISDKNPLRDGKAIRGGVPVCWPWFGPAGEPAHGFARNLPWELSAHDENEQCVMLTLALKSSEKTRKLWPHNFTLFARFRLGERCEIELEAHGEFESTAALHSYFAVADIDGVSVSCLGPNYIDKVKDGLTGTSDDGVQTYPHCTDRIYTQPENRSIISDKSGERVIEVHHHHHSDVVTWNPGPERSCSMADMANEGYKTMVCVETAHISQPMISRDDRPARLATTFRVHSKK
ncbi:D-hexose-6-phosphate mutarotase [Erwinia amylovora]|uniref:D-hexose-6-phosphate mutarotase n=1 Tax=Erwinia amylovora TaxID=552 RepID=UPI000C06D550|nr:D-hexose-6-phosphate mutarotase [Erwinia amylovora]